MQMKKGKGSWGPFPFCFDELHNKTAKRLYMISEQNRKN